MREWFWIIVHLVALLLLIGLRRENKLWKTF
jgi:hypothetical protein